MGAATSVPLILSNLKCFIYVYPRFGEVETEYTGFTLSVHPSVDGIVPVPYHQQNSLDPFHIHTSFQVTSKGVSRVKLIAKFQNVWHFLFKFVTLTSCWFDLGSKRNLSYGQSWCGGTILRMQAFWLLYLYTEYILINILVSPLLFTTNQDSIISTGIKLSAKPWTNI